MGRRSKQRREVVLGQVVAITALVSEVICSFMRVVDEVYGDILIWIVEVTLIEKELEIMVICSNLIDAKRLHEIRE